MGGVIRVETLRDERKEMRSEIIVMEQAMHRTVFAFVAVCGVIAGLYFSESLFPNRELKGDVLLVLSQLLFVLGLFNILLLLNQSIHVGYIRALEAEMNAQFDRPVALWETVASKEFIYGRKSRFYRCASLFVICAFIMYILLTVVAIQFSSIFVILTVVEAAVVAGLLVYSQGEESRVCERLKAAFAGHA